MIRSLIILLVLFTTISTAQDLNLAVQKSHSDDILFLGSSQDGSRLVSLDASGFMVIWDVEKGKVLRSKSVPDIIQDALFNGRLNEIFIDNELNVQISVLDGGYGYDFIEDSFVVTNKVAIQNKLEASTASHNFQAKGAKVIANRKSDGKKDFKIASDYFDQYFNHLAASEDHNLLLAACEDGKVYAVNTEKGKIDKRLDDHYSSVNAVIFSGNENYFFSASNDRSIIQWNAKSLEPVKRLYGKIFNPLQVRFINGGKAIAVGDELGYLRTISFAGLYPDVQVKQISEQPITDLKEYDSLLYVSARDNKIRALSKNKLASLNSRNYLRFHPRLLDYTVKQKWLQFYQDPDFSINALDISTNGKYMAFAGGNDLKMASNRIVIVDTETGKRRSMFLDHSSYNDLVFVGPDELFASNENHLYHIKIGSELKYKTYASKKPNSIVQVSDEEIAYNKGHEGYLFSLANEKFTKIEYQDSVGQMAINPLNSSQYFMAQYKTIALYDHSTGEWLPFNGNHNGNISDIHPHPTLPILISSGRDGTIRFWNTQSREMLATMAFIGSSDFVVVDNENNYFISKMALGDLGFVYGKSFVFPEQFDLRYNRPDLVLDKIQISEPQFITAYKRAYEKRLKRSGLTLDMMQNNQSISFPDFEVVDYKTKEGQLKVTTRWTSDEDIRRLKVWVNDVPVFGQKGQNIHPDTLKQQLNLNLVAGDNKVELAVVNQNGTQSVKKPIFLKNIELHGKPNLYVLSIGVSKYEEENYNLAFAAKDAQDIANRFARNKNRKYEEVYTRSLTDSEATRSNILDAKLFLEKAGPNDVVLVFIAGHGVLDAELNYYFGNHDINFNAPSESGLAYNQIEQMLSGLTSLKKVLFMDTCHSGELDKEEMESTDDIDVEEGDLTFRVVGKGARNKAGAGLETTTDMVKNLFADSRIGTGTTVISSSGGAEFAIESKQWKNGLFTYCLLEGMENNRMDLNNDGITRVSEVRSYLYQKVLEKSNGRQSPNTRIENISQDIELW